MLELVSGVYLTTQTDSRDALQQISAFHVFIAIACLSPSITTINQLYEPESYTTLWMSLAIRSSSGVSDFGILFGIGAVVLNAIAPCMGLAWHEGS